MYIKNFGQRIFGQKNLKVFQGISDDLFANLCITSKISHIMKIYNTLLCNLNDFKGSSSGICFCNVNRIIPAHLKTLT